MALGGARLDWSMLSRRTTVAALLFAVAALFGCTQPAPSPPKASAAHPAAPRAVRSPEVNAHALLIGLRTSQARALVAQVMGREQPGEAECWASGDLMTLAVFLDDRGELHIDALPALLLPTDGGFSFLGETWQDDQRTTWTARNAAELRHHDVCPIVVPEPTASDETEAQESVEVYAGDSEECEPPEPERGDRLLFATTKALCISGFDCSSFQAGCDCGFKTVCGRNEEALTWLDGAGPTTVSARHGRKVLSKVARAIWKDGDNWGEPPPLESTTISLRGREVELETISSCLGWKEGVLYETATQAVGEEADVLARTNIGPAGSDLARSPALVDFARVRQEHPGAIEAAGTRDHEVLFLITQKHVAISHGATEVLQHETWGQDLVMAERAEGARALEWMREVERWHQALSSLDQRSDQTSP